MTRKTSFGLMAIALLSLSGCVGYNTTMFMTKSNVGLDFDAKPPTAEINISRKEAVIEPSFEGGQTPPVLASFKPHAGVGSGFQNFFVGVDQTFAGGDAAVAMSKLYGDQDAPDDSSKYSSALKLSKAPKYSNYFQRVPGPGEVRPFIFSTDTMLGLKAAWSGTGGQIPDTVKLGFNRKEYAWAPLSMTTEAMDKVTPQRVKMPSFLATIESHMNIAGYTNESGKTPNAAEIVSLQYFATGDAARLLALRRTVRMAMLARLDPNSQQFKSKFGSETQGVLGDTLFAVKTILDRLSLEGDRAATDLRSNLDHLSGIQIPSNTGTPDNPIYSYDNSAPSKLTLTLNEDGPQSLGPGIAGVISYLDSLEASVAHLSAALNDFDNKKQIQLASGTNGAPITARTQISNDFTVLTSRRDNLRDALSSNRQVIAAYRYVESMISPE